MTLGLEEEIIDQGAYKRNVDLLRSREISLPLISEIANPIELLGDRLENISEVDPDKQDSRNLFRVHWHNNKDRKTFTDIPEHIVLEEDLTGVKAKIVVALGCYFPMINTHKVLAAYGCLLPRLLSGTFDAKNNRAVWPSTGNYCRGGVAIANLLGCRSVAVLPEGMSKERFDWLYHWLRDPADIHKTPGTESNVKEIYDACNELSKSPQNIILNQFSEYGNYIVHRAVTGVALERIFNALNKNNDLNPRAFIAATGSAGTLAAGDYLKQRKGFKIGVVEAIECPTLLYNGYGEHNIQGIGDKHVPLIHNVMNSDFVIGVSEQVTDRLGLVFNSDVGRRFLSNYRGITRDILNSLNNLGLSSLANIIGAIKYSKYMGLGSNDVVLTIATDGYDLYKSELNLAKKKYLDRRFDEVLAAQTYGHSILGTTTDHILELSHLDRERMFNLGYYTWVEQQGIMVEDFDRRRNQSFWNELMKFVPIWDDMIKKFNAA